jgi:enoyl-CoA hydratase
VTFENILLEKDGAVARVTINRPDKMNALNHQTLLELGEAFDDVKGDADIRALVITGAGEKAFVAGADIGELLEVAGQSERRANWLASGSPFFASSTSWASLRWPW